MQVSLRVLFLGPLAVALALTSVEPARAAAPRKGYTKILLNHLLFTQPNASAAAPILGDDATVLADYESFTLVSVPDAIIETIKSRAAAAGIGIAQHDEYDLLGLPGGNIDTRVGLSSPPGGEVIANYPSGKYGLYVLQFIGPIRPEWIKDVFVAGGVVIEAVPLNGYIVALKPESVATILKLPEVQFLEIYHPFLKAAMVDPLTVEQQDVLVEFAETPGIEDAIMEVTSIMGNTTRKKNRGGLYLYGKLKALDVRRLLANPLVVGVHRVTRSSASDERQAMSLSSNVTTSSGNLVPTYPGTYSSWLTGATACDVCGNLSSEGFTVGIADSGVVQRTQWHAACRSAAVPAREVR